MVHRLVKIYEMRSTGCADGWGLKWESGGLDIQV